MDFALSTGSITQADLYNQAQHYGEILNVCLANVKCTGLLTWGFTDKYSWIPQFRPSWGAALPFDTSYQPKPAYSALLNALNGKSQILPPAPSTALSPTAPTVAVTLNAIAMATKTVGAPGALYPLYSNGYIEDTVNFPVNGVYRFQLSASGTQAAGLPPIAEIRIDGVSIGKLAINSTSLATFVINGTVNSGAHKVQIAFINDGSAPGEDRNLFLSTLSITKP